MLGLLPVHNNPAGNLYPSLMLMNLGTQVKALPLLPLALIHTNTSH
jgi:hypothetical protein